MATAAHKSLVEGINRYLDEACASLDDRLAALQFVAGHGERLGRELQATNDKAAAHGRAIALVARRYTGPGGEYSWDETRVSLRAHAGLLATRLGIAEVCA